MIKKAAIILLLFFQANVYSQAIDDFGTWWGVEIRKTFLRDFRASVQTEVRLNENSAMVKNFYIAPSIRYSPLKWLYVALSYRFDNRYQQERYFTQRHRLALDVGFTYELKKFDFEYRTRLQMHWEDLYGPTKNYPIMYSRNQLAASFKWPQLPFTTSLSGEVWLPLHVNTELSQFRMILCQEYKFKKRNRFQLRFVFQTDLGDASPLRSYILSARYIYAF